MPEPAGRWRARALARSARRQAPPRAHATKAARHATRRPAIDALLDLRCRARDPRRKLAELMARVASLRAQGHSMLAISFLAASWASPDAGGARQRPPVRARRARAAPAMALPALPALQPAELRASARERGRPAHVLRSGLRRDALRPHRQAVAAGALAHRVPRLPAVAAPHQRRGRDGGERRAALAAADPDRRVGADIRACSSRRHCSSLLRIKRDSPDGKEVQVLSAFGNSGVLPLLFVERGFAHAADATLKPRAISYVSMFLLGWSPAFWTGGYALLGGTLGDEAAAREKDGAQAAARQTTPTALRWRLAAREHADGVARAHAADHRVHVRPRRRRGAAAPRAPAAARRRRRGAASLLLVPADLRQGVRAGGARVLAGSLAPADAAIEGRRRREGRRRGLPRATACRSSWRSRSRDSRSCRSRPPPSSPPRRPPASSPPTRSSTSCC